MNSKKGSTEVAARSEARAFLVLVRKRRMTVPEVLELCSVPRECVECAKKIGWQIVSNKWTAQKQLILDCPVRFASEAFQTDGSALIGPGECSPAGPGI